MLINYRFLLQPPQNETQLQSSFFFCFSKLPLFIWFLVEKRIAKGIHRWLRLLHFGGLIKNKPTLKQGFRKHLSHCACFLNTESVVVVHVSLKFFMF